MILIDNEYYINIKCTIKLRIKKYLIPISKIILSTGFMILKQKLSTKSNALYHSSCYSSPKNKKIARQKLITKNQIDMYNSFFRINSFQKLIVFDYQFFYFISHNSIKILSTYELPVYFKKIRNLKAYQMIQSFF